MLRQTHTELKEIRMAQFKELADQEQNYKNKWVLNYSW
jgi:hypothetical protein